jgi:RNA recognition motif-containing protein
MNIYVGNLASDVTDEDLRGAFAAFGQVDSAAVVKDKFSGTSRGFGFVEMPDKGNAQSAINDLNDTQLKGRNIIVNEARPRTDRPRDRDGGGGRGGRGGPGRY